MLKVLYANGNQKRALVTIFISDKTESQSVTRDKDGHYIVIKGSIYQEDITIYIDIYIHTHTYIYTYIHVGDFIYIYIYITIIYIYI